MRRRLFHLVLHEGAGGQLFRFALVGSGGFLVDSAVLFVMLHGLGTGPYAGRLVSFLTAVTFTWAMNRRFTFRDRSGGRARQWLRFLSVATVGGLFNLGIYVAVLALLPPHALTPFIGVALGSLGGFLVNFTGSRRHVFELPDRK